MISSCVGWGVYGIVSILGGNFLGFLCIAQYVLLGLIFSLQITVHCFPSIDHLTNYRPFDKHNIMTSGMSNLITNAEALRGG